MSVSHHGSGSRLRERGVFYSDHIFFSFSFTSGTARRLSPFAPLRIDDKTSSFFFFWSLR